MGLCHSSSTLEGGHGHGRKVLVAGNHEGDQKNPMASLYSRKGRRGIPNQDSAIICQDYASEDGVLCGVFDGHGRNGHIASRMVRDNLPFLILSQREQQQGHEDDDTSEDEDYQYYSEESSPEMFDEWKEACVGAFKSMDKDLARFRCCHSSGSTAVTVIRQGMDLIIANLGDSRAILGTIDEDGDLAAIQLTTDLKPDLPHEAERIKKSNGRVFALRGEPNIQRVWLPDQDHPGLAMARAFGDFQLKKYGVIATPHVTYHHVRSQDQFVVLATDGVWDVLSNEEVATIARSVTRREDAAKAVAEAAARAWKSKPGSSADDCTVVCLHLHEVNHGSMED